MKDGTPTDIATTVQNYKKVLAVNAQINSTLNLDELLGILMTTASEVMQSDVASLMLVDEEAGELVFKVALGDKGKELTEKFRLKIGEGIGGYVAQTGEPVIVNDTKSDERFAKRFDNATGFQTKAIICVPMKSRGKVIGILQAINPVDKDIFTQSDLELFEIFADQATLSVENAKLHTTLIAQEKSRRELEIAQQIQQNFLPNLSEKKLKAQVAAKNISALSVGGDFYDVVKIDENRTGIIIGDVSGKGVPAALYMVRAISEYRFTINHTQSPTELLGALNQSLSKNTSFGMFVTLLYILLDHKAGTITYSSSGHHPILYRGPQDTEARYLEDVGGMPCGLMEDAPAPEQTTIPMEAGSVMMLYTDGVTEARDVGVNEFGEARLKSFLNGTEKSAAEYADGLIEELQKFTTGAPQHDDTTVLAIKI